MSYPDAAWERAMTVQEVMLKALSGELHWFRAARTSWGGRRGRCGGGASGMRRTGISASWESGGIGPRFGASRRQWWDGCCSCIASGIRVSMSATFIRSRGGSTA